MRDYYAILQVDPRADPEVIEAAYRRLARKWHPDANPEANAARRMQELNEAYEVLSDRERRRSYDAAVRSGRPSVRPRAGHGASVLVWTALGVLGALVGIRFLGSLVMRAPLLIAFLAAVFVGVFRSLRHKRNGSDWPGSRDSPGSPGS